MTRTTQITAWRTLTACALALFSQFAHAYEVLNNGKLRFGTGAEASVNANGNLQQPFYYDASLTTWYKLTFSNYPLDNAVAIGGDGTAEWNLNGTLVMNGALAGQALDVSAFTATSGSVGYGTIVSTGQITIGTNTVELRNTYELGADKSFVKITTRLTNTSATDVSNVRVWVGTRDDWVGATDRPTKQRGNLDADGFHVLTAAADRAAALKIFSGQQGVLFYSTSPKAHTSINSCCAFQNSYQQNPATSAIELTNDGSYALFVRMADLAPGASEEFTWYYAAGALENLDAIVDEVAEEVISSFDVTAAAGAHGSIDPTTQAVAAGATAQVTVTPDAGYRIDTVDGCGGSLAGSVYTTGAIGAACTVTATFARRSYTVTASAGQGGTIAATSATVEFGGTATFAITPTEGYDIASVAGCGGTLVDSSYTTGAIAAACTVSASFQRRIYTVSVAASNGGEIAPHTLQLAHGATASFSVQPSVGYSIVAVSGCSGTLDGATYTIPAITAACTLSATFQRRNYTVTVETSTGGEVTPVTTQFTHGTSASFSIVPSAGYSIASVTGCGGTLDGNTYTTSAMTGGCAVVATFEVIPPAFEGEQLRIYDLRATELLTPLPGAAKPRAFDYAGTALAVELLDGATRFSPGSYILHWRATDARGVAATFEQQLRVWPIVQLGPDLSIGARAGNYGFFRIALNGRSPVYPFQVPYEVSGDLDGHDLRSGIAVFYEEEVEKQIGFAVTATAAAGSAQRAAHVALDAELNLGRERPLTVSFTTVNQPARIALQLQQGGEERSVVARDSGPITLAVDIVDPDTTDHHTVQWNAPAGASFTLSGESILVDPASLLPGVHRFEAVVTDDGTPPLVTRRTFDIVVLAAAPVLPKGAIRLLANGLPDHPDYAPVASHVLPERGGELTHHLMEADAGTRLALGPYTRLQGEYQTELQGPTNAVQIPGDAVANVGGYFDFVVDDLPRAGESVSVVLPQRAPIPPAPVYRKYDPNGNRWNTFVEDAENRLASAPGTEGFCPPPASDGYRSGLHAGDWCVRITILDGGANDGDGAVNGSVSDPGGIGSLSQVVVTATSKGGGGGGAMDPLLMLAAALLLSMGLLRQRRTAALVLGTLAVTQVNAAEIASTYVGSQWGVARSNASAADLDAALQSQGFDVAITLSDRSRSAWRAYAGRQLLEHFAVEAGYVDLGEISATFSGTVADIDALLRSANALQPPSAEGVDVAAVFSCAPTSRLELQARAGVFFWDADFITRNGDVTTVRRKEDGMDGLLGVGAELRLVGQLSARADAVWYGVGSDHIDLMSIGLTYRWR